MAMGARDGGADDFGVLTGIIKGPVALHSA